MHISAMNGLVGVHIIVLPVASHLPPRNRVPLRQLTPPPQHPSALTSHKCAQEIIHPEISVQCYKTDV
jgi:hypothetical protein